MPSGPPLNFADFHGGLNVLDSPHLLQDDQCRDCMNVQGTTAGAIVKRAGLKTFASPAVASGCLIACEVTPQNALIISSASSLFCVDASNGAVNTIKTGLSSSVWEGLTGPIVSGQGPLFLINGIDPPQQWSGTSATVATGNWSNTSGASPPAGALTGEYVNGIPNGKYCTQANNQMYITGNPVRPNRVYVSALRDFTLWDPATTSGVVGTGGATAFDIDPNDGQVITAIGRVGPYVIVFKPRKAYVIVNPGSIAAGDNLVLRRLSDSVGCIASRSVSSGRAGTYFLSEDRGVYITNGSTFTPVSDKILPILTAAQTPSLNLLYSAAGCYFGGHYYLSIRTSVPAGSNNLTLDYDEILQSWWKHSFGGNEFAVWHPSNIPQNTPLGLYAANAAGPVDQCFAPGIAQDHGGNFTWVWRGPWQSPSFYRRRMYPSTWYRKRLRQIRIQGVGTVDYSLAKNFDPTEASVRSNLFPGSTIPSQVGVFSLGVARAFSQVFSATSSTAQDQVLAYTLALTDRVDRWD